MFAVMFLALTMAASTQQTADDSASTQPATQPDNQAIEQITIGADKFRLEIAADDASRSKGLMGQGRIERDGGMLFVYSKPALQNFWMANCAVDIDIVFLDARGRIVATHEMKIESPRQPDENQAEYEARLKRYSSRRPAQFALELQAGSIASLGLKIGQKIQLDAKRLEKLAR